MSPFGRLARKLLRGQPQSSSPSGRETPPAEPAPAFNPDNSLAALVEDQVLAPHRALILRIKSAYGFDDETFEQLVMATIRRLAGYLHLLPATPSSAYRGPGGALRMGLEIGFFSLQHADGQSFARHETARANDMLRHRWRLASLLAGFFSQLPLVFSRLQVANESDLTWAGATPLVDWLTATGSTRYFLRWREQAIDARALSIHVASQVIPPDVVDYLTTDNRIVFFQMLSCIAGPAFSSEKNHLAEIVRRTASAVIERNMRDTPGTIVEGPRLDQALVEGIRALLASADWLPNAPNSRAWYAADGLFLAWPASAESLRRLLPAPWSGDKKAEELLEELLAAELVTRKPTGGVLWRIQPPRQEACMTAIRLTAPIMFLESIGRAIAPSKERVALGPHEPDARPGDEPPMAAQPPGPASMDLFARGGTDRAAKMAPSPRPITAGDASAAGSMAQKKDLGVVFREVVNPIVRDAVEVIIQRVNLRPDTVELLPHEHGVFVTLAELEAARVDPAVAARSLFEANMLYVNPSEPSKRVFNLRVGGGMKPGVVIRREYLSGWDAWQEERARAVAR